MALNPTFPSYSVELNSPVDKSNNATPKQVGSCLVATDCRVADFDWVDRLAWETNSAIKNAGVRASK